MTMRAMGAFNGLLPEPTGMVQGFLRDPSKMPYLRYVQMVPAPEITFMYAQLDSDEGVRLTNVDQFAWGYDDYRPTGKAGTVRVKWVDSRTTRWDFPYTIGNATQRVWNKAGIPARQVYDRVKANQAALHRASRVISELSGATWGSNNTSTLAALLGSPSPTPYFDKSSGQQYDPASGADNPNFQVIKRALGRVKRRIHLATNAAVTGEELVWVMPPVVAEAVANSGEMVEFLKGSPFAKDLTDPNIVNWNLPPSYAGFKIVVEDTPRVFIAQNADGTVADVTVAAQKDYILNTDTCYFLSRPGGLDGGYGFQNFSTVQCYHFGGEGRVEAFSEPKHDLIEGHVVMEDKVIVASVVSGFALTDVLSPG